MEDNGVKAIFDEEGFVYLGKITKDGITDTGNEPFIESSRCNGSTTVIKKLSDEAQFAADMAFTSGYAVGQSDMKKLKIEKVEFNGPATIVWWSDGDKTVVKDDNYEYNRGAGYYNPDVRKSWEYNGLANAVAKKMLPNYVKQMRKFLSD